jgi:hypothetical protein
MALPGKQAALDGATDAPPAVVGMSRGAPLRERGSRGRIPAGLLRVRGASPETAPQGLALRCAAPEAPPGGQDGRRLRCGRRHGQRMARAAAPQGARGPGMRLPKRHRLTPGRLASRTLPRRRRPAAPDPLRITAAQGTADGMPRTATLPGAMPRRHPTLPGPVLGRPPAPPRPPAAVPVRSARHGQPNDFPPPKRPANPPPGSSLGGQVSLASKVVSVCAASRSGDPQPRALPGWVPPAEGAAPGETSHNAAMSG